MRAGLLFWTALNVPSVPSLYRAIEARRFSKKSPEEFFFIGEAFFPQPAFPAGPQVLLTAIDNTFDTRV